MNVTSTVLIKHLAKMHPMNAGWVFIDELRIGTGYGHDKEQRIDAWAINCWPSVRAGKVAAPNLRRAFEIKVDRADVCEELRNPDKRWVAYSLSHEFYFVAPKGLIRVAELSKDDGLIEFTEVGLSITKPAKARETMPPKWTFVASIARRFTQDHRNGIMFD